jgi:lipopolysaccharide heptosyltransferase II
MRHPERIAVFRALQLGDMLCAVPALRALRAAWPRAAITLIGLPWARDFAERMPYVDHFLEFPGFPGLPEIEPDLPALKTFLDEARARKFHLAIQMHGDGTLTNPLVTLLGAEQTAGFAGEQAWCPDPRRFIAWPAHLPEVRRLLALVRYLGAPPRGEYLELPASDEERAAFDTLRRTLQLDSTPVVCVHPGARLATRRWPARRFAQVADMLAGYGYRVVLTGSAGEAELVEAVRREMHAAAVNLAGKTALGTLAALVAHARLVICNDTGMSHVAAATRTPSVVVCSGADPMRWQPLDASRHRMLWHPVPCRPCAYEICPSGHECALGVSAEQVIAEAARLLDRPLAKPHVEAAA